MKGYKVEVQHSDRTRTMIPLAEDDYVVITLLRNPALSFRVYSSTDSNEFALLIDGCDDLKVRQTSDNTLLTIPAKYPMNDCDCMQCDMMHRDIESIRALLKRLLKERIDG